MTLYVSKAARNHSNVKLFCNSCFGDRPVSADLVQNIESRQRGFIVNGNIRQCSASILV